MMREDNRHTHIFITDVLKKLSMVFHKAELEAALAQQMEQTVTLEACRLLQWGLHRVQGDLYLDRKRVTPEIREKLKYESDRLVRRARQVIAADGSMVCARDIAGRLAASKDCSLFSRRAIETIVAMVAEKLAAINRCDVGKPAGQKLDASGDDSGPLERLLWEFNGFISIQEIEAGLALKRADTSDALRPDKRYAIEALPGVWIHRGHVDEILRQEARQAKENLLVALPARFTMAAGESMAVVDLVAEFEKDPAFRRFSRGALGMLICQFAIQNRGYTFEGDVSVPLHCRIASAVRCQDALRHQDVAASTTSSAVADNTSHITSSEEFSTDDLAHAEQRDRRLADRRQHHHWREDFGRHGISEGVADEKNVNTQGAHAPFSVNASFPQASIPVDVIQSRPVSGDVIGEDRKRPETEALTERQRALDDFHRQDDQENRYDCSEASAADDENPWEEDEAVPWMDPEDFDAYLDATDIYSPPEETEFVDDRDSGSHQHWPNESEPSGDDWGRYEDELDEFDEEAGAFPDETVQTEGRLSRKQRANQIAIEIGQRVDWDAAGIDLLSEVFLRYGWSATRASIERALESEMTPEELRLTMAVREMWQDSGIFSEACVGFAHHHGIPGFGALSWPMALALVRRFDGLPDLCEIEDYIQLRFDEWIQSTRLHRRFPAFGGYLCECVQDDQGVKGIGFEWEWTEIDGRFEEDDAAAMAEPYRKDFFRSH